MGTDTTLARPVDTDPERDGRSGRDPFLWLGVAVATLIGAALRLPAIGSPLVQVDEPTTMLRALDTLRGDIVPPFWDWPPFSAYVLAGAIRLTPGVGAGSGDDELYLFGRLVFAAVSLAVVVATGWLAAETFDGRRERRVAAIGGALAVAVGFMAVRNARLVHPEQLQVLLLVVGLAVVQRVVRRDRPGLLPVAGLVLGLSVATKYLGGVGLAPAVWVASVHGDVPVGRRLARAGGVVAAAVAGVLAGTLGTVLRSSEVLDGLSYQFLHQTGGHLGYDGTPWLHVTQSLPGNWGWPLTVVSLFGVAYGLVAGPRRVRVLAVPALIVVGLATVNEVRFPHYVLLVTPLLAILAFWTVWRLAGRIAGNRPALVGGAAVAALALTLVPTVADDVRGIRADASPDTRELAQRFVRERLADEYVLAEVYALPGHAHQWGREPAVLDCGCYALISSYMEERFRLDPQEHAEAIAVYDDMRERGEVVEVIAPFTPLSYRWDVLPQWGLDLVPLTGEVGPTGPTITVVDLTG